MSHLPAGDGWTTGCNAGILVAMTSDNNSTPLLPTGPDERWRRIFILAINQLAGGDVDHLALDQWAVRAQARHGHRNAVEVAHEEWACGRR